MTTPAAPPCPQRRRVLAAVLAAPAVVRAAGQPDLYLIDPQSNKSAYHAGHVSALARAALDASWARYGPYELRQAPIRMERDRLLQEIRRGGLVNLAAQVTSAQWERELLAVRIPIDKGVTGYRIGLIDGRRQAEFSAIRSLAQLRKVSFGGGRQWSSTAVMAAAGFKVVEGNSSAGLHSMLAAQRFAYFPRALDEAWFEQEAHVAAFPALSVERSLLLYLPLPRYFFLPPGQPRLAQRLEYGMQQLAADGRFDRIFHAYYDPVIARSGLRQRRLFRLANPFLTPQTPLSIKSYWYDPFA
ncbi:hypothetical protein ACLB1G_14555 [Oxalobacteraceae bacterium A2-2]